MANKNITLRRKISGGFDTLRPETKLSQVKLNDGNPLSTLSLSIAEANLLLGNVKGYGMTDTNATYGDADKFLFRDAGDIREAFEIAEEGHNHPNFFSSVYVEEWNSGTSYSFGELVKEDGNTYRYINATGGGIAQPSLDVNQAGIGTFWGLVDSTEWDLNTILNSKVSLDENGDIEADQFATVQFQGMRFEGTFGARPEVNGITFVDTAEDLFGTLVDYDSRETAVGVYKIAVGNVNNATEVGLAETYNDGTYDWTIRHYDDGVDVNGTGTVTLEAGDWIIYEKFESNTFYFSVVNNQYRNTSALFKGIGQVTPETVLTAYEESRGGNAPEEKLIDETALRDAIKDIREVVVFQNDNQGVIKYYSELSSSLSAIGADNDLAMVGTGTTKDIYQKISGTWVDSGSDVVFPSGVSQIGAGGGDTYYDDDNAVYMITQYLNGVVVEFITTNAEPIENDLVFYVA